MIRWVVIGIQSALLTISVLVIIGLGVGWYISYQNYIQPREEVFYDGVFYVCRFMGGTSRACQESVGSFYSVEAFQERYTRGAQDWVQTQGKDVGEVR